MKMTQEQRKAWRSGQHTQNGGISWIPKGIQISFSVEAQRVGRPDSFIVWTGKGQVERFKSKEEGLFYALNLAAVAIAEKEEAR